VDTASVPAPADPHPGSTAPESLLEVPSSVTAAADDFFDGVVRRAGRQP
jgi:hypothetical protein